MRNAALLSGADAEQHDRQQAGGGLVKLEPAHVRHDVQQRRHPGPGPGDGQHDEERHTGAAEQQKQQDKNGEQHPAGSQLISEIVVGIRSSLAGELGAQARPGQLAGNVGAQVADGLVGGRRPAHRAEADRCQRDQVILRRTPCR
jgi:hypothetical protein